MVNLLLQVAVVAYSFLAFTGFFFADRLCGSLSLYDSSPAVIGAVEFGRILFAGAIRFAAGALGGGDAARHEWQTHSKDCFF